MTRQHTTRTEWTFLRRKRRAARLTLSGLAEATGYSVQYLSNMETGLRGCGDEALFKIADAIGVDVETLDLSRPVVPPRRRTRGSDSTAAA
jgi:transcriptional regulator with XRE-family HTH domain